MQPIEDEGGDGEKHSLKKKKRKKKKAGRKGEMASMGSDERNEEALRNHTGVPAVLALASQAMVALGVSGAVLPKWGHDTLRAAVRMSTYETLSTCVCK